MAEDAFCCVVNQSSRAVRFERGAASAVPLSARNHCHSELALAARNLLFGPVPNVDFQWKSTLGTGPDRKSTRLNSSHGYISYAVFCLKKEKSIMNVFLGHLELRNCT